MKNKFLIFSVFIIISINSLFCYANTAQPVKAVPFIMCQKSFVKQSEPFFYVVLSSLIKNNYKIEEIQSKNGLIIFKVYNKEFLANVSVVDYQTTLLKITPVDNNYAFSYSIIDNLFKTIEEDLYKDIFKLN